MKSSKMLDTVASFHIWKETRKKKMVTHIQPLPWKHSTDGKHTTAILDAEGFVVCGSLICRAHNFKRESSTHAFIVAAVNTAKKGSEV